MYDLEFQNRDSDTHMELTRDDLMHPREQTQWEMDLVEAELSTLEEEDQN